MLQGDEYLKQTRVVLLGEVATVAYTHPNTVKYRNHRINTRSF
ncbi:hypothetical protein [Pedobacter sp. P26]